MINDYLPRSEIHLAFCVGYDFIDNVKRKKLRNLYFAICFLSFFFLFFRLRKKKKKVKELLKKPPFRER